MRAAAAPLFVCARCAHPAHKDPPAHGGARGVVPGQGRLGIAHALLAARGLRFVVGDPGPGLQAAKTGLGCRRVGSALWWGESSTGCRTIASCAVGLHIEHYECVLPAAQVWAKIRDVSATGRSVVCFCLETKHRSCASVVAFLIQACGLSFADAWERLRDHRWQELHKFNQFPKSSIAN